MKSHSSDLVRLLILLTLKLCRTISAGGLWQVFRPKTLYICYKQQIIPPPTPQTRINRGHSGYYVVTTLLLHPCITRFTPIFHIPLCYNPHLHNPHT